MRQNYLMAQIEEALPEMTNLEKEIANFFYDYCVKRR